MPFTALWHYLLCFAVRSNSNGAYNLGGLERVQTDQQEA